MPRMRRRWGVVQGAYGGAAGAGRDLVVDGAAGLGGHPPVAGVGAFEGGGDAGALAQPAPHGAHGVGVEGEGPVVEEDVRGLVVELEVGDVQGVASSLTVRPVAATSAARAAVRMEVAALAPSGRWTARV